MSIQIDNTETGLVTLRITGKLHQPDLADTHRSLAVQFSAEGKSAILVDAREFGGWAEGGDWGDLDAQHALDPLIRKMAVVVDPQWETLAIAFTGKGLRGFPIEIFTPSEFPQALAWVAQT